MSRPEAPLSSGEPDGIPAAGSPSLEQLSVILNRLGCPREKCDEMAAQLNRRAHQLAEQTGRTHLAALTHLLSLMREGWAARERGLS